MLKQKIIKSVTVLDDDVKKQILRKLEKDEYAVKEFGNSPPDEFAPSMQPRMVTRTVTLGFNLEDYTHIEITLSKDVFV